MSISGENLYKGEDNSALHFVERPVKNNFQSEQHGRPIFDTGLFVEVITPGSTESQPEFLCELRLCAEANNGVKRTQYYDKYKAQIEDFKAKTGAYVLDGLPISQWAQIDAGTAATLQAAGIRTVEQLAGVSDSNLINLGTGGRTLREQAKQFTQNREFGVVSAQAGSEMARKDERIAELEHENASLRAELAAVRAQLPSQVPVEAVPVAAESEAAELAPPPSLDPFAALRGEQTQAVAAPLV